mgnify:CR=1 FL=1
MFLLLVVVFAADLLVLAAEIGGFVSELLVLSAQLQQRLVLALVLAFQPLRLRLVVDFATVRTSL